VPCTPNEFARPMTPNPASGAWPERVVRLPTLHSVQPNPGRLGPRLNSAISYITPKDMFVGHQQEIQAERDRKLDAALQQRKNRRQRAATDETDYFRFAHNTGVIAWWLEYKCRVRPL
jgi:hypothetical protein